MLCCKLRSLSIGANREQVCFETLVVGQNFAMATWNNPALPDEDPRESLYWAFRSFVLSSAKIQHSGQLRRNDPTDAASVTVVWVSRSERSRQVATKSALIQLVRSSGTAVFDVSYGNFHAVNLLALVHQADVVVTVFGSASGWGYFQRPNSLLLHFTPNWGDLTFRSHPEKHEFGINVATYLLHGCALAGVFIVLHSITSKRGTHSDLLSEPYNVTEAEFRPVWHSVIELVINPPVKSAPDRLTLIEDSFTSNI